MFLGELGLGGTFTVNVCAAQLVPPRTPQTCGRVVGNVRPERAQQASVRLGVERFTGGRPGAGHP